jgi:hypothetical protein
MVTYTLLPPREANLSSQTTSLDGPKGLSEFWRKIKFFVLSALKHRILARRINTVLSFIFIVITDFKLTGLDHLHKYHIYSI